MYDLNNNVYIRNLFLDQPKSKQQVLLDHKNARQDLLSFHRISKTLVDLNNNILNYKYE